MAPVPPTALPGSHAPPLGACRACLGPRHELQGQGVTLGQQRAVFFFTFPSGLIIREAVWGLAGDRESVAGTFSVSQM